MRVSILRFAAATAVLFAQFAVAGRAETMAPGAPAGALYTAGSINMLKSVQYAPEQRQQTEYGTLRSGARPQLLCTRGKVLVQNRCVCPSGTFEQFGKCAPRLQRIPGKIVCPKGSKLTQGKCIPIVR